MKNEIFEMLKIYEHDFPEQMSMVTKTEVIAHYYQTLEEINDKEINDNCVYNCTMLNFCGIFLCGNTTCQRPIPPLVSS